MLLSGDGHTSVRERREAPRDEADLCWQLLLQLLCIFHFQVQSRAAIREDGQSSHCLSSLSRGAGRLAVHVRIAAVVLARVTRRLRRVARARAFFQLFLV